REVVVRIRGHVVPRDAGDRPQPVRDERGNRADQHPVEPSDERRDIRRFASARAAGCSGGVIDHQSEWIAPCWAACLWKNSSNTFSAAGAAASPPCPPFSIGAQTTRSGEFDGPYPHHHDWLNVCM